MIEQPPTAPKRIPGPTPLYYTANDAAGRQFASQFLAEYNLIPAALRQALEKRIGTAFVGRPFNVLKFIAGSRDDMYDEFGRGYGRNPGDVYWAGLYRGASSDVMSGCSSAVLQAYAPSATIIHEFGHHLDNWARSLWPIDGVTQTMTAIPEFLAVWNASKADIPSVLYGATNMTEWFAEAWRCQIQGDTALFMQLVGNDSTRALALRKLFTDRLPMPAFPPY